MSPRHIVLSLVGLAVLAVLALLLFETGSAPAGPGAPSGSNGPGTAADARGNLGDDAITGAVAGGPSRELVEGRIDTTTGVRGIVVDMETGAPVPGVEVTALRTPPAIDGLVNRFRGLFTSGLWVDGHRSVEVLGRGLSAPDGTFEILGLPAGTVFLDGRSGQSYVRTPAGVRLAQGEIVDGVELRAELGGRIQGTVYGPDGGPVSGALVSLRPDLNAFLGQMTERRYRWLEASTDGEGRFDLRGVPVGNNYTLSAGSPEIALEEVHGVDVFAGRTTTLDVRTTAGAAVAGRVLGPDGQPVAGANVAMVYLDLSRVLFSADGREEPITTDSDGYFRMQRLAAGRVAFVAVAEGLAPSAIEERAVVDGGIYDDLELYLDVGTEFVGSVVDQDHNPLAGATVEIRPIERPRDSEFLKMMLKIRRIEVETAADGTFRATGLQGDRLRLQASKPGYTTAVRSGVRLDTEDGEIQIFRGAVVRGAVRLADGTPVERFRVQTRSTTPRPERNGDEGDDEGDEQGGDDEAADEDRPGVRFDVSVGDDGGEGRRRGRRWGRMGRDRTRQLPAGQSEEDRGPGGRGGGGWQEIQAADGTFRLTGIPPGDIRVRVQAVGYLDPESQTVTLTSGQEGEPLVFEIQPGVVASGRVLDAASGMPVSDAMVTAYRKRDGGRRGWRPNFDAEDFDFLGLSAQGKRTSVSNSRGEFAIDGLQTGDYRFTARHPDMAKASATEVTVGPDAPPTDLKIVLDTGGGVEGHVTGQGMRPLRGAVIVALSVSAGDFKSTSTDAQGYYRIDGLSPGQYMIFKSRMDERSDNLGLDLMSNMRLKAVNVKHGRFSTLDIHDEGEDGVRVHGVVRENGQPVPRALVTALGTDSDGILGMGVRANAADRDGRYELVGLEPGSYVFQVSTFRDGRPRQTTLTVDVPWEVREYALDLEIPSSSISGRVIDAAGQPVAGVQVTLGSEDGDLGESSGLLGLVAQGGMGRARTDDEGNFEIQAVAPGSWRVVANGGGGGPRRGGRDREYGSATLTGVRTDGYSAVQGLEVVLPRAGRIVGVVLDGSGNPVPGAEVFCQSDDPDERQRSGMLQALVGMQARPETTDENGAFELGGMTPGTYSLRADAEGLETGSLHDVVVPEGADVNVQLTVIRGATLKVRVTNVKKEQIPLGNITLLDGNGKKVVNRLSVASVMRRFMSGKQEVDDSGWYTFGSVPPDTYTAIVQDLEGREFRIVREVKDGETVEWDIDLEAELRAHGYGK